MILVFLCQAVYITGVVHGVFSLFILLLFVAIPDRGQAQSACEEGKDLVGVSLAPLSGQGLSVSAIEPLGFASRLGIQVGDVIEQANNQLTEDCRSYRKAVAEARKDKKALFLLVNSQGKKRAVLFERTVWEEPEKKAEQAVASLKALLETPLPPPVQGQVKPLGEDLLGTLLALESVVSHPRALSLPGSLSRYEQKLGQTEEHLGVLKNSVQGEAEKRVMDGAGVILDQYRTAREIWQYKIERLAQTRVDLRQGQRAVYNAPLPYFLDSPVLAWVDRYPVLRASIATPPRKALVGEKPGEWNPDAAILLLWQEARKETDKLSDWLKGAAHRESTD